jgi:hypothetical protein
MSLSLAAGSEMAKFRIHASAAALLLSGRIGGKFFFSVCATWKLDNTSECHTATTAIESQQQEWLNKFQTIGLRLLLSLRIT